MEGLVGSWCGPPRHFSTTCSGLQPLSLVGCEGQDHGLVRTPYTYPMFLTGAGAKPQPVSHGGDGAAAAGGRAAQEADCSNPRTFPLGDPRKHATREGRKCGLGGRGRGLDMLLSDTLETPDLEVTRDLLNLDLIFEMPPKP